VTTVAKETKCLFCSLCCPMVVEILAHGEPMVEFVDQDPVTQGRLCYRGHFVPELLNHPRRLTSGRVRKEQKLVPCSPDVALETVASALKTAIREQTLIFIDGNMACEDIGAGLAFAREVLPGCRAVVWMPPDDEQVLAGIADVHSPATKMENLSGSDLVLAIGDPFAGQPVIAKSVLDAKEAARGNQLIVIDTVRGKTARFATIHLQPRLGMDLAAVAALASGLGIDVSDIVKCDAKVLPDSAGIDASGVAEVVEAVKSARAPVVVLSMSAGKHANIRQIACIAARIALKCGSLLPLLTYGNAVGAWSFARANGALTTAEAMAALRDRQVNTILSVGAPIADAVPQTWLQVCLNRMSFVASAMPMPSGIDQYAHVSLPLGYWFESDGNAVDGVGNTTELHEMLPPPRGALRVSELFERLGSTITGTAFSSEEDGIPAMSGLKETASRLPVAMAGKAPDPIILLRADGAGFAEGSIMRQCRWSRVMEHCPSVWVNPADAKASCVNDKDTVTVRTEQGSAQARVNVTNDVPAGCVAVSPNFPKTTALLDCSVDEEGQSIEFVPTEATLTRIEQEEGVYADNQ